MNIQVFNRYENKYLVSRDQYEKLLIELSKIMRLDPHNENGRMYTIYNLYYDTDSNNLIRTSLEKPVYKEKIRMRAYDLVGDDDIIYVEMKKKFDGLVNKRRTPMQLHEAKKFLNGSPINVVDYMNSQVVRELSEVIQREPLFPKVNISYQRMAFFDYESDDLRISFDHKITARRNNLGLDSDAEGECMLPDDQYLMEIKTRWTMPLWLVDLINDSHLMPISFSKYGKEYMQFLKENYV